MRSISRSVVGPPRKPLIGSGCPVKWRCSACQGSHILVVELEAAIHSQHHPQCRDPSHPANRLEPHGYDTSQTGAQDEVRERHQRHLAPILDQLGRAGHRDDGRHRQRGPDHIVMFTHYPLSAEPCSPGRVNICDVIV